MSEILNTSEDSCTIDDIKAFYPDNTLITSVKGSKNDHTAILRLRSTNKNEFNEWLKAYKTICGETMRVSRGISTSGKSVVYKAWYRCQHNTETYHTVKKQHSMKNTGCKTNCLVKIKSAVEGRRVRSQDKLRSEYPTEVIFHRNHNHSLQSAEALKFKDVDEDVKTKFIELFKSHHSPSRALEIHKQDLLEELEDDYYRVAADRSQCPDLQWVYKLYYQIFEKEFGGKGNDIYENLKESIDQATDLKVKIDKIEDNVAVAIITPFMERVHTLKLAGHIVFVDSSGNMDRHNCRVFLIMCDSSVGGLPLGIILTTSEAERVITRGFDLFKEIMSDNAFNGRGHLGPEVFLTDDSTALRNALTTSFSASKLWLCAFHILQAVWRWLNKKKNNVRGEHKQDLLMAFKKILISNTTETFDRATSEFKGNEVQKLYPEFGNYVDSLLQKSQSWSYSYRGHSRNNNTNNIVESAMNVLKDKILNRCRAFNVKQLFYYLSTTLPDYYSRKMLDIISNRHSSYSHLRYLPNRSKLDDLKLSSKINNIYEVTNTRSNTVYNVNLELGTCTCPVGCTGAPCKHQHFVSLQTKSDNMNIIPITTEKKNIYHWVATGNTNIPTGWYDSLCSSPSTSEVVAIPDTHFEIPGSSIRSSIASICSNNDEGMVMQDKEDAKLKLQEMFQIMAEKLEKDPQNFVSAVRTMHRITTNMKHCDSALCSVMHNFGKISTSKKYATNIPVQPTSIGRRRSGISSRKCQKKGRPSKNSRTPEHGYACKSKSQSKAPHSLSECVARNIALGKK